MQNKDWQRTVIGMNGVSVSINSEKRGNNNTEISFWFTASALRFGGKLREVEVMTSISIFAPFVVLNIILAALRLLKTHFQIHETFILFLSFLCIQPTVRKTTSRSKTRSDF